MEEEKETSPHSTTEPAPAIAEPPLDSIVRSELIADAPFQFIGTETVDTCVQTYSFTPQLQKLIPNFDNDGNRVLPLNLLPGGTATKLYHLKVVFPNATDELSSNDVTIICKDIDNLKNHYLNLRKWR